MSNILYSIGPMDDEDKVPIISLNSLCRLLNSMYVYIYIYKESHISSRNNKVPSCIMCNSILSFSERNPEKQTAYSYADVRLFDWIHN